MMLKLVVFDCDGVMFDSRQANKEYYNQLLTRFSHPPMSIEELDFVHMHNAPDSVKHIFRHYPEDDFQEIENYRATLGYTPFLPFMKMEVDLIQFLEHIRTDYHLAISTNRANTMMPLLEIFNLKKYFKKVVTSETAKKPKPAPDGLVEILEFFKCLPSEAIFIGDSIIDREHSASCNVPLIAFKNNELPAEYHVTSFMQILSLPPFQHKR